MIAVADRPSATTIATSAPLARASSVGPAAFASRRQAVAVTVIGGTLLSGGYGSVVGTVLGAITFGMIQVGLVLAGAPGHFFKTLTGIIVVGAVILNTEVARRFMRSKPLGGYRRGSQAADAAVLAAEQEQRGAAAAPSLELRQ